jgi:hypothetical protein
MYNTKFDSYFILILPKKVEKKVAIFFNGPDAPLGPKASQTQPKADGHP